MRRTSLARLSKAIAERVVALTRNNNTSRSGTGKRLFSYRGLSGYSVRYISVATTEKTNRSSQRDKCMWTLAIRSISASTNAAVIRTNDELMTFSDVTSAWETNADFREWWSRSFPEISFASYCWETPPLTKAAMKEAFECVFALIFGLVAFWISSVVANRIPPTASERSHLFLYIATFLAIFAAGFIGGEFSGWATNAVT